MQARQPKYIVAIGQHCTMKIIRHILYLHNIRREESDGLSCMNGPAWEVNLHSRLPFVA